MTVIPFKTKAEQSADDVKIIYEGFEGKILQPLNKYAAAKITKGTGWLIENPDGYFQDFDRIKSPILIFIPSRKSEPTLTQRFGKFVARKMGERNLSPEEVKKKYPAEEMYYGYQGFNGLWAPVADYRENGGPNHYIVKKKIPPHLLELILGAARYKKSLAHFIFENTSFPLKAIPPKYRTASICYGALKGAEESDNGAKWSLFPQIPTAVRQDKEFQQLVCSTLNTGFFQNYYVSETGKYPATLIQRTPDRNDDIYLGRGPFRLGR